MNRNERFQLAGRALAECRRLNRLGQVILIEGRRDKEALLCLGFEGDIEQVNRGWALEKLIIFLYEKYESNPIILMDWDRTGGRLQKRIMESLSSMDVKPSDDCRKIISKALKPETLCVEDLDSLADELLPIINHYDDLEGEPPSL